MEASELRLGNFFKSRVGDRDSVCTAFSISRDSVWFTISETGDFSYSIAPENIDPIPLTEEWLIRFGFETMDAETDFMEYAIENDGTLIYSIMNDGGLNHHDTNPFYITSEGQLNGWACNHKIIIQFVHQLQNAHFALTQTELKLKELAH